MSIEIKEKSPAKHALFHYQYGMMMFQCGRNAEAKENLNKLETILRVMVSEEKEEIEDEG